MLPSLSDIRIGVLGLGYVGLPLAAYLARAFPVVGLDTNEERVRELKNGIDRTHEITQEEFKLAAGLSFTSDIDDLKDVNFFIIAVPTPIDDAKRPDLSPLTAASEKVAKVLKRGDIVVYESTVFPGASEEICVPVIEAHSGLKYNAEFFVGYSPERVNPADPTRRFPDIKKITSGSTPEVADLVDRVYAKVVTAGTHRVSSIRVAEAAKVIENVQRDVNIALVNELSLLFRKLGVEVSEVLQAAETKWNFHYYRPGLVGGHCIGVDPYYLTHKAQQVGFHPEMILAGRRINDSMPLHVAQDIIKSMLQRGLRADGARVLVMGVTFKQNCPDIRNTKVVDLIKELCAFGHNVSVFDPLADKQEVDDEFGIKLLSELPEGPFDAVVLAVKHDQIVELGASALRTLLVPGGLLYDVKGVLPREETDVRL